MGASGSSNSRSANYGDKWEYKIYFDPEADKPGSAVDNIQDSDLIDKLKYLVGVDEKIIKVTAYKEPLTSWQLTENLFYHFVVLFETQHWWWTIEKHYDGITLQRSRIKSAVKLHYRERNRQQNRVEKIDSDVGTKTIFKIIKWLYETNELNKPYHLYERNCKHFGRAAFNYIAKYKKLE